VLFLNSCGSKNTKTDKIKQAKPKSSVFLFNYNLDHYNVVKNKIKNGETFGKILDQNHIQSPKIYSIVNTIKPEFDVRKLRAGKNYTILTTKDSLKKAKIFIYQHNLIDYSIIDFTDSIFVKKVHKKLTTKTKTTSGIIINNLSTCLADKDVNCAVAHELSDIYAWTIDFFRLQKNDKFKVIYEEKYIEDSIPVGIGKIKAAYFEHVGKPFYAFNYTLDSLKKQNGYFDEQTRPLERAFLKAPLKFSRISSRFNLKRRIRLYGNKIKPHLGTDFAAPVGSPIMTTANGTVIASAYRGGNGNYVKVKHNSTYTTQYLHMKKRKVKVGDYVKQGDIIGWVGMTGNTSGPHVCYRFWKNGKQVDPLKQKMNDVKPMEEKYKKDYLAYIEKIKIKLDTITY